MSVTKLPVEVIEEEQNILPYLLGGVRLDMPVPLALDVQFQSNYLANNGSLGLEWMLQNRSLVTSIGLRTSVWFGHLEMDYFRLKTFGIDMSPSVSAGLDLGDVTLKATGFVRFSYMKTDSDDKLLLEKYTPLSAYGAALTIEQPLWNDHWVALSIGATYAKFTYHSWITYTTLEDYLFYPEATFGFVL